jgi:iron complex transport system ATP-binding protein
MNALTVEALGFEYDRGRPVFSDISFELRAGEIFVLLGPNGAGKTTLLNCVAGLLKPSRGRIEIFDRDAARLSAVETARLLAYLPQSRGVGLEYSVEEYAVMGRAPYLRFGSAPDAKDYAKANEVLARLGVARLARAPCSQISGGEYRQAQISRVLMQDTKLLLMDEPTNHLDYGNQIRTLRLIADLAAAGYAVLLTSHTPDHAILLGSRVGVLAGDGSFTSGDAKSVLTADLLRALYGADIRVVYVEELGRPVCAPDGSAFTR